MTKYDAESGGKRRFRPQFPLQLPRACDDLATTTVYKSGMPKQPVSAALPEKLPRWLFALVIAVMVLSLVDAAVFVYILARRS
jgi:hypothetical protein